jgi:hypothetical protein
MISHWQDYTLGRHERQYTYMTLMRMERQWWVMLSVGAGTFTAALDGAVNRCSPH